MWMQQGVAERQLDPAIWKAIAGAFVQVPKVYSRVFYFPQGHAEQATSPPALSGLDLSNPAFECRVQAVLYCVHPKTDEVFLKIRLAPISRILSEQSGRIEHHPAANPAADHENGNDPEVKVFFSVKVLTPSDANNGCGFSVPRSCAETVFPPLNYEAEHSVQTISVIDVHGNSWKFRHIYRGTPRRHMLTTGWSKFVDAKKLIAGDSIVFVKNQNSQIYVGIRRKPTSLDCWRLSRLVAAARVRSEQEGRNTDGFSRSQNGRVPPESVVEAVDLAAKDKPFEVDYYPNARSHPFVIKAELVESSLKMYWDAGMIVRMALETEDSSRLTWFQGVVSSATVPDHGMWKGSPWRMLEVTWDEPEILSHVKKVSPWQVEYVDPSSPTHISFLSSQKKIRFSENPIDQGELLSSNTGLTNSKMGPSWLGPSWFPYNNHPAGMQGARHVPFYGQNSPSFKPVIHQLSHHKFIDKNLFPGSSSVSPGLNISSSQPENLSPNSQSSVLSFGGNFTSSTKAVQVFKLFGANILVDQQLDESSNSDDDDDDSKGEIEEEGMVQPT